MKNPVVKTSDVKLHAIRTWTHEDLRSAGIYLYGQKNWRKHMAYDLGVHYTTVKGWSAGGRYVPNLARECLKIKCQLKAILTGSSKIPYSY